MDWIAGKRLVLIAAAAMCALALGPAAQAEDFFSALFGGYNVQSHVPATRLPFANPFAPQYDTRPRAGYSGGGQAYCVRTCDGRYFPIAASDNASRAASCSSFCPASETRVFYGSNMGDANIHDNTNLPILLAGGGFKHGQHIAFKRDNNAPLCNLFVSVMQRMGVETDAFASSSGRLTGLELT